MSEIPTLTLTTSQLILIAVAVITIAVVIIAVRKRKNKTQVTQQTAKSSSKSDSDELKFQAALKLFFNTCEYKFNYWFEKDILPVYLSKGAEHVTAPLIKKTFDNYMTDMKACVHPKIYELLLKNYFSDPRSVDIFLKQYFSEVL